MCVHRKGERRRAAMVRELPDHVAEFANLSAAAAEIGGDAGLDQAGMAQVAIIVGDEGVVVIRQPCPLGEFRPEFASNGKEIQRRRGGEFCLCYNSHRTAPRQGAR
jgi:hypothetical protein